MILNGVTESLELVTGSAGSIDYSTSWADYTATTFLPSGLVGNIILAATTTIVAAPVAATQRQLKFSTIRNRGSGQTVYLQKNVSGTLIRVTPDIALASGEVLEYIDGQGWVYLDSLGQRKTSGSGSFANSQATPYFVESGEITALLHQLVIQQKMTNFLLNAAFNISTDLSQLQLIM